MAPRLLLHLTKGKPMTLLALKLDPGFTHSCNPCNQGFHCLILGKIDIEYFVLLGACVAAVSFNRVNNFIFFISELITEEAS